VPAVRCFAEITWACIEWREGEPEAAAMAMPELRPAGAGKGQVRHGHRRPLAGDAAVRRACRLQM